MKHYERVYYYCMFIIYILYGLSFLGIWNKAPIYLENMNIFFKLFISIVLIYLFNPLQKTITCTDFHMRIVFSAAVFLITSTTFSAIKLNIYDKLYDTITHYKTKNNK